MVRELAIPELPPVRLPPEGLLDRLRSGLAGGVDAGLLRAMQLVVDSWMMPSPEALPALRASAARLRDPALQAEPARFFDFGEEPRPRHAESRTCGELPGGRRVARRLESAYRPRFPEDAPGPAGAERAERRSGRSAASPSPLGDDPLRFEHWLHERDRPRGTLVALHGFTMGRPRVDAVVLLARRWYRRGLDVVLPTLPGHGARTPPGARFSGEAFAVPDVGRLAEAVRRAVWELRLLSSWLRRERPGPVGLLGLSLGGYLAALMAGLYDDLDFVVPMAAPVCMGDLAWRFFQRSRRHRGGLPPAFTREELRRDFRVHSPLAHPPRVPRERLLVIAGRGDRIVPPEHPAALWEHWQRPAIHWFVGSHVAPLDRAGIVAAVTSHLEHLGIL